MARRLLRYAVGALAALAFVQAVRVWQASGRDITVVYKAPKGPLKARLLDDEGSLMRAVQFSAGTERRHVVQLPDGTYTAEVNLSGKRLKRDFVVGSDHPTVVIDLR